MSFIESLLFIDNPNAAEIAQLMINECESFLPVVFVIALTLEFFRGMNFKRVIFTLLTAILTFNFFIPFHQEMVKSSLRYSDTLVTKYDKRESFSDIFKDKVGDDNEEGLYESLFNITGPFNNIIGYVLNGISYFCLFLLKYIYSIVYYLTMILVGISALLSFFPVTQTSLNGSFRASLWCAVMPLVVAFILILVGNSDVVVFTDNIANDLYSGFTRYISLLMMSICIILSPLITTKLLDGTGINSVADTISKAATFSTINPFMGSYLSAGKQVLMSKSKFKSFSSQTPRRFPSSRSNPQSQIRRPHAHKNV